MTHGRNAPSGWRAYRAFRQTPAPVFVRHHGNWQHGRYSKAAQAARREMRLLRAVLRGKWIGPSPWQHEPAPGWSAYRSARNA